MNKDELLDIQPREGYESRIEVRSRIVEILTKVETRQAYSDKLLDRELKDFKEEDRRFITEVVNGVIRWRGKLDWYLNQLYLGEYDNLIPDVKNNLRSSVYQLKFLDKIPPYAVLYEAVEIAKAQYNQKTANLVNAILRNFLRQQKKFDVLETQLEILDKLALRFSHPRWLVQRWIEYWGIDEVTQLCEANNQRPRLAVRLNAQLADRDVFFKSLDENGILYEVHPDFPNFVWIDNFQEFRKLDFLIKGWVSVQDVSTGMPVLILDPQPGETVLDMCAAPGGKSGYIAEKMQNQGLLLVVDRHLSRVRLTRDNLVRLSFTNFFGITADSQVLPVKIQFDRILVDAPCSGFGVLSKRVDIKWKRTEQDILNMREVQLGLLRSAAIHLKPGGVLVYSTCTIEPEENERVVESFLNEHPEFELDTLEDFVPAKYISQKFYIQTFPHKHGMDGSFAARMVKKRV
ncbi:MAG: 16S rRNA (cytosine(967)-C(5))-methyltransferase RsmB [Calditrichia bacterium]